MIVKLTPYVTVAVSESIWDKILGSALELVLECLMYQCLWHFAWKAELEVRNCHNWLCTRWIFYDTVLYSPKQGRVNTRRTKLRMYLPTSLCAGLGRGVAGVRGQKPLDTGESQVRFPGHNNYCYVTVCYHLHFRKWKTWSENHLSSPATGKWLRVFSVSSSLLLLRQVPWFITE